MRVKVKLCLALAVVLVPQMLAGESLSSPDRTLRVPNAYILRAVPIWSRGYLIYAGEDDGSATVYATASDQYQVACQTRIWPAGAERVLITHAAACPSGSIFAVSGGAFAPNGIGTGFIAFFGQGRTQLLVQLPNTGLLRIVFADDGTLWALVRQVDSSFNELGEYNLLRHYDINGKFLGSAVPRPNFQGTKSPMYNPSLSASHDTIGIYFDRPSAWMELSYDGSVKGLWQVPRVPLSQGQRLGNSRLYLTTSNQVVRVSWLNGSQSKDRATLVDHFQKSGPGLAPTPVDFTAMAPFRPTILGIDGEDHLVWLQNSSQIDWSKLQ